jgi:tRNA1(Val) A37 N6-methylase TrmN6
VPDPAEACTDDTLTDDSLLDGRVRLHQPRRGLRAGLDAVLLAAAVPARPGQVVLEAGCGAGAGFLCVAARIPGLTIIAVERDPALAAMATANAARNGLAEQVTVLVGDITDPALAARLPRCDQAFANPPWWPGGTPPPEPRRQAATHLGGSDLAAWARFLGRALRRGGTLTLVLPAGLLDAGIAALLAAQGGSLEVLPLWPKPGQAAKRVLLRARRDGRGQARLLPGLVLHGPDGTFSAPVEAVLRGAAALEWG